MSLLSCKFTSIRAVLDKAQDIKDAQKEIIYMFLRQDNRQQSFLKFFCGSNVMDLCSANPLSYQITLVHNMYMSTRTGCGHD